MKDGAKRVRIGIIGTGWPGQQHAIAIRAGEVADLHACADLDPARRSEFETEFEPRKSFADYHDLLGDRELEAVMICLPNALHFPASLAALEAGKHVFCEKPPTLNAAEMKVLHEEATKRGLVYFFGRQFRFTPAMIAAKRAVEQGRLGTIYFAKALWVRSRGIPTGIGGWFTDKKRSGGGVLIDIGIHALDSVWYLMGTPKPTAVDAKVFRNFAHLVNVPVFDVDDGAYAFLRFDNGAVVQLETSWAGNLSDDIPTGRYFGRERRNSIVYGTKATVRLDPLTLFEDQGGQLVDTKLPTEDDEGQSFQLQLENFVAAIRGEAEPVNNSAQAVALMEMLDAIYASSAVGREVPIV